MDVDIKRALVGQNGVFGLHNVYSLGFGIGVRGLYLCYIRLYILVDSWLNEIWNTIKYGMVGE
jgi:hypothetical protein